jgi:hypothetical protein
MKGKLLFVAGIGVGYLLGARAGRGSYERIRSRAQHTWNDPRVQQGIHDAGEFVKDNAPVVAAKAKDAASGAVDSVKSKVGHSDEDGQPSSGSASAES